MKTALSTQKICHIGPLSIHSTRWIEAFHQKGYNVSLITGFRTWIAPKPKRVPIYFLPTFNANNAKRLLIPNFISILKTLKEIQPCLVHLHVRHHYAPIIYVSRIPYILHSWGLEVLELPNTSASRKVLAKQAAAKARRIIVDAECMKQIWTSLGIPGEKVEVIPFGVDTHLFNPHTTGAPIREKLGIGKRDIAIISTRPFFSHYDLECLVKAISLVVEKSTNLKFIIKGKGPLKSKVEKLAKRLQVEQYIRFTDPVPFQEMPQYLAAADLYVSTSFIDSTSVSLLEAMACGLPPITTDISGNREWIKDGENGLLYPPRDYGALAEKILQLLNNEGQRKRFGERCLRIVKERATWEKCVSKLEVIYQSLSKE